MAWLLDGSAGMMAQTHHLTDAKHESAWEKLYGFGGPSQGGQGNKQKILFIPGGPARKVREGKVCFGSMYRTGKQ